MKFQESISEWSIETATSSLIRGSCSTQFVKIRDKIRKKKKLQTSKVQPWFLLIKEENYQVVGWYFKKIFPNDRWKRRHCFASLLRGSHFRRNYAGKSWINACLKPASFRRNAIRVIRRAPLSVSLSLSLFVQWSFACLHRLQWVWWHSMVQWAISSLDASSTSCVYVCSPRARLCG